MEGKSNSVKSSLFDSIKHIDENDEEYWLAREFAETLDYSWESFEHVITRSKLSVAKAQGSKVVENHFRHMSKMVSIGYGNTRAIPDVRLTRYACYIVAQNGSPARKPAIALAQSYFAIQARRQELADQRQSDMERLVHRHQFSESDKGLSEAIMQKEMSPQGLGIIKSSGDKVMYGGLSTKQMKKNYGMPLHQPLPDRLPNVVLAAKTLANEITTEKLAQNPIDTFNEIKEENDGNNAEIRRALGQRGIVPEKLAPAEDTGAIMKRVESADKHGMIDGRE